MLYDNARVPVVALDYTERQMAKPKEFLVDYNDGRLFVMSKDGSRVIDITNTIANYIKGDLNVSDIVVSVEGVGDITLKEILEELLASETSFFMEEEQSFAPDVKIDNASLKIKDLVMQIDNFDIAEEGSFPQKKNGRIQWMSSITAEVNSVSPMSTFNDGSSSVLVLEGNKNYKLNDANVSTTIALDDVNTNYANTKLMINIGYTIPTFLYNENIKWENGNPPAFNINTIVVLEFETFDKGANWLGSVKKYR